MFNHATILKRPEFLGPIDSFSLWADPGGGYVVALAWTNRNSNYYTQIFRGAPGGSSSLLYTANPGETSYNDTTALDYEDYEYTFVHYDGQRQSTSSVSDTVIARAPRLASASAVSHTPGACPGADASNLVSWTYTGTIGAFTVSVYLSRNAGAQTLIASGLAPAAGSYEHFLTNEYDSGAGSSSGFVYTVELKAGSEQAANSPLAAAAFFRDLDPCGV